MTRQNEIFIKNLKNFNKRELINMITEFVEYHEKLKEENTILLDNARELTSYVGRLEITVKTIMEVYNNEKSNIKRLAERYIR